jgi:hypothetical protein
MRAQTTRSALIGLIAAATVIAAVPFSATAAPAPSSPQGTPLTGEPVGDEHAFVDNRPGAVAARARMADVRYNRFGTPASLTGKLATGLSKDPETAYEVVPLAADAEHGYTTYIDARDGSVLVRENLVNFAEDNPHWKVFVSTPTTGADSRQTWCAAAAPECQRVVLDPATGRAWDIR